MYDIVYYGRRRASHFLSPFLPNARGIVVATSASCVRPQWVVVVVEGRRTEEEGEEEEICV